ncbi:sialate O-acetylesterase [Paenibacillus cymbidii]|uniref:sialate O-acetylesterase n=1 Tax=Paenibacillus cymbidii TaxID=1639034 RepID=UPI00108082CC|nr:sialate O-acetylesterase [Paenibacillus cymbidii]
MKLTLLEVEAYRVYQRDDRGQSDIPFRLQASERATGNVEARISSAAYSAPWQLMGVMEEGSFSGKMENIPVGKYSLEFRVTKGDNTAMVTVSPVFVGDLWLLAGQSNMEGCGKEIDAETPMEGVSCFYLGDRWALAEEPLCWLQEAIDPVHWRVPAGEVAEEAAKQRSERANGAGLGLTFAKELLRETGIPIGLVIAAHGGTRMEQWDPARANEGWHSFYGAMLRKIRKLGGRIKGCLWYQGESDANESFGPMYRERTNGFINSLRRDTGDEKLPFLYAQLSVHYSQEDPYWWNFVQQEQLKLESQLDGIRMVPTIDASLSDGIHLDARSLQAVGRRMAWAALSQAYNRPAALSGPRPGSFAWNADRTELSLSFAGINGRLAEVRQVFGFRVEAEGCCLACSGIVAEDGRRVVFAFDRPVPQGATIRHGFGRNPVVNVRDSLGIPLPVFAPIPV